MYVMFQAKGVNWACEVVCLSNACDVSGQGGEPGLRAGLCGGVRGATAHCADHLLHQALCLPGPGSPCRLHQLRLSSQRRHLPAG